ncbi:polysaccharide biosynthesis protein [Georgenia thermotolerans]|uniref:NAD-dependent epimerase/dehydratase family protein n=1 Tax=Georgenia thermotolerans TaxID=527326 RepID=A0A7J5USF1_9MICO|nr:nucleoside-diphosphate sugar epimerase/dehydratase [Georgenia thermotolerans]KAE8765248.1 NAD-dependent epimerase/dehydratase family protein [Georgenia thermotolerans]
MIFRPATRRAALAAWDVLCWLVAAVLATGARYDFAISEVQWTSVLTFVGVTAALQVVVGYASKMYRGRYRVGTFDEALGLALLAVCVALVSYVAFVVVLHTDLPRGVALLAPPIALMSMASGRWVYRLLRARGLGERQPATRNVVIYGAGDAGYQLLRLMLTDRASQYRIVGLIDDNPGKRNLRLMGVPVIGNKESLPEAAIAADADTVILAIASATGEFIGEVQDLVEGAGLEFLVLPPLNEMFGRKFRLGDVRKADIADVLGRRQVETDLGAIADYLAGRRVLITGAGGSIGSELARQVYKFGPAELVLLDRDESELHAVQLSIYGKGLLDTRDMVLADIRDADALRAVFEEHRPEIVFHAAALKHLPMLEQYPQEGWKTNVLGTLNVLSLAADHGVRRFVNISTDKAADPTSVLGQTKRLAEQLTAWMAERVEGSYMSVRFGNVLGSRGSMLHTFNAQIEAGGPVTVTHPEVTRYFMTIPEACELVIQAGAIGGPGEVLVLDMGTPVKILDVAKRLIARSGKEIDIVFTGLRPGEKMHEDLFGGSEQGVKTAHPLISHVSVPPIEPAALEAYRAEGAML